MTKIKNTFVLLKPLRNSEMAMYFIKKQDIIGTSIGNDTIN